MQDKTKAGGPRFYALRSLVNYGALPRTYEDPDVKVSGGAQKPGSASHTSDAATVTSSSHSTLPCHLFSSPAPQDSRTGLLGDGDPIDVCEIGSKLGEVSERPQKKSGWRMHRES